MSLNLYRRHLSRGRKRCPFRARGRAWVKCACPIWAEGRLSDGRLYRASLKTRDWQRAVRKLALLESPDAPRLKPIAEAVKAWEAELSVAPGTRVKYSRLMEALAAWCQGEGLSTVAELDVDSVGRFRGARRVQHNSAIKELSTLRQFFRWCQERGWCQANPAARIKMPREHPNEVEPYTAEEMAAMLVAAGTIGNSGYERARARALLLVLRYIGLRLTDAYCLRRDRIKPKHGGGWEIGLYTQKTRGLIRLPVPAEVKAALDAVPLPRSLEGQPIDSGHYFWSGVSRKEDCAKLAWRTLHAVFTRAKVAGGHAHRFRHTLATSILAAGGSMSDVADVLGISERVAERYYAKWSPARQERIAAVMEAVFRPAARTPNGHEKKASVN